MTEEEFRTTLQLEGWDVIRVTDYQPRHHSELHAHEFSAKLLVLEGAFVLAKPDGDECFLAGQLCVVPAGTQHAERTRDSAARVIAGITH